MGGLFARMPGMGLVVAGYKDVEGVYIGYGRGGTERDCGGGRSQKLCLCNILIDALCFVARGRSEFLYVYLCLIYFYQMAEAVCRMQ